MAALTVADELGEAGRKMKRLEDELLVLRSARSASTDRDRAREGGDCRGAQRRGRAHRGGGEAAQPVAQRRRADGLRRAVVCR